MTFHHPSLSLNPPMPLISFLKSSHPQSFLFLTFILPESTFFPRSRYSPLQQLYLAAWHFQVLQIKYNQDICNRDSQVRGNIWQLSFWVWVTILRVVLFVCLFISSFINFPVNFIITLVLIAGYTPLYKSTTIYFPSFCGGTSSLFPVSGYYE